ncbi:MAG: cupin domain-containing protein [Polyangiaceae bacterium]|nr:cupin domain-containing protein [Polyangiaceae bacterium]
MDIGNLFTAAEPPAQGERFEELLACRNLRIERIVSSSAITPSEYVQEQDEWVALLRGEATLDIAGERVELRAGDHVFLPARTPHTVLRVSEGALWLAVHLR